jgi:hypothetical protein
MREEHFGLDIASYHDPLDFSVCYNFENKGTKIAKIEYGDNTIYLEPGETTYIKVNTFDLSKDQSALPRITMLNRGNPDA